MLFYSEDRVTPALKREIHELIGAKIDLRRQLKQGAVGSGLYRLRYFRLSGHQGDVVDLNSRCTFEKFERGLLLRINDRQKLFSIAISYASITGLELIPGEEVIDPIPFCPLWILLKLGVHVRYARYFVLRMWEYSVDPMTLKITAGEDMLELDANGYNFHGEQKYFQEVREKMAPQPSVS